MENKDDCVATEKADLFELDRADGATEPPLGRTDWIGAALGLLIEEGIDAVRITRLAETLEVTRGSFYWHFKDRDDLCDAMMAYWERTNTAAVLTAVESSESLSAGILTLFDAWLDVDRFDPKLDSAMRDWARRSDEVKRAVEQADTARVDAISALFEAYGYEPDEARIRARVIYFGQVGYYALGIEETLEQRLDKLETYYLAFTGRTIDPALAAAYRARHLGLSTDKEQGSGT